MTLTYTRHFRFGIPDFNSGPWHAEWSALVNRMDAAFYAVLISAGASDWANATAYLAGDITIDRDDGSLWIAEVDHTSIVAPSTFADDRSLHPSYWTNLMPDASAGASATAAELAADSARRFGAMAVQAESRMRAQTNASFGRSISQVMAHGAAVVSNAARIANNILARVSGFASASASHAAKSAKASRDAQNAMLLTLNRAAALAGAAAYAQRRARISATAAAASAASVAEDQIVFKAQVFNG